MKRKSENQSQFVSTNDSFLDGVVVVDGCDPAVANATGRVRQRATKSHTLNSRRHSLLTLVRESLDGPVTEFLKERCPAWKNFCISESLQSSAAATRAAIGSMIHKCETDDVTYATLETLLYFSEFCESRGSVEPIREERCKLCWRRTEFEEALWEPAMALGVHALVYRGYVNDDNQRLNLKFCSDHDPGKRSAAYRSAYAQNEIFRDQLDQVADWFVDQRIAPFPHELRKIAYLRAHPKWREKKLAEVAQGLVNHYASRKDLLGTLLGDCDRLRKLLEERRDIVSVNANSDGHVFFRLAEGKKFQALPMSDVERNMVISNAAKLVNTCCGIENPSIKIDFPELGMMFTGAIMPMTPAPAFSIAFELPTIYFQAAHSNGKASCES